MTTTFEISTDTFPVFSVDMYQSNIEPVNYFDMHLDSDGMSIEVFNFLADQIQYEKYCEAITPIANEFLQAHVLRDLKVLDLGDITLTGVGIVKRTQFNTSPESLNIDLELTEKQVQEIANRLEELDGKFDKYLAEKFTSREGFWSWVPNNRQEFIDRLRNEYNDREREVGFGLYYLLVDYQSGDGSQENYYQQEFEEYLRDKIDYLTVINADTEAGKLAQEIYENYPYEQDEVWYKAFNHKYEKKIADLKSLVS